MKQVLIIYRGTNKYKYVTIIPKLIETFNNQGIESRLLELQENDSAEKNKKLVKHFEGKYLCALDFAGYDWITLLEKKFYNMLPFLQLHIVTEEMMLKECKNLETALNVLIALPDSEEAREWLIKQNDIANYYFYPKIKEDDLDGEGLKILVDELVRQGNLY